MNYLLQNHEAVDANDADESAMSGTVAEPIDEEEDVILGNDDVPTKQSSSKKPNFQYATASQSAHKSMKSDMYTPMKTDS